MVKFLLEHLEHEWSKNDSDHGLLKLIPAVCSCNVQSIIIASYGVVVVLLDSSSVPQERYHDELQSPLIFDPLCTLFTERSHIVLGIYKGLDS